MDKSFCGSYLYTQFELDAQYKLKEKLEIEKVDSISKLQAQGEEIKQIAQYINDLKHNECI